MRANFDGVEVFVEVVECGGFARAADRLALTRSAVGKTIARMEARLGVRLFHRTTRTQSLTEDGQIYYERCLRALDELRMGEAMVDSGRREVRGRLRITMPALFGRYRVQPLLLGLARAHPALELELHYADRVVDLIADGFDLAIRNGRPGAGSGLTTRRIATQYKRLYAAPDYLARHGTPATPAELGAHDALAYVRDGRLFGWAMRDGETVVEPSLSWRLQFDDQEAIADAAVAGMGIAWLPSWLVAERVARGQLVPLLSDHSSVEMQTYAVWPSAQHLPMRLRVVIDALAAGLEDSAAG